MKDVLLASTSLCAVKRRASGVVVLCVGVEVAGTWICPSVVSFMPRLRSCTHPQRVCVFVEVLTAELPWTPLPLSGVKQWLFTSSPEQAHRQTRSGTFFNMSHFQKHHVSESQVIRRTAWIPKTTSRHSRKEDVFGTIFIFHGFLTTIKHRNMPELVRNHHPKMCSMMPRWCLACP